jgi:hypothetical protein
MPVINDVEYIVSIDGKNAWDYAPNFPKPAASRWEGICFHTTESHGQDIATAISTVKWQGTTGNKSNGSYHLVFGRKPDGKYAAIRSVRADKAAGGISTRRDSIWRPDRYPELKQYLSAAAYADPNAYLFNVAISGDTIDFERHGYPDALITALAWMVIHFETPGTLAPKEQMHLGPWGAFLCGHYEWQTNRTDPGPLLLNKVLAEYARLKKPATPKPTNPAPNWQAIAEDRQEEITRLRGVVSKRNKALRAIDDLAKAELSNPDG